MNFWHRLQSFASMHTPENTGVLIAAAMLSSAGMASSKVPATETAVSPQVSSAQFASNAVVVVKPKITSTAWRNPAFSIAFDVRDWNRAGQPETMLIAKIDGRDVAYDELDKFYFNPASMAKEITLAAVLSLKHVNGQDGMPVMSENDLVLITKDQDPGKLIKTKQGIKRTGNAVACICAYESRREIGTRKPFKSLMKEGQYLSANDIMDSIIQFYGQKLLDNGLVVLDDDMPYKAQRAFVSYANKFAREQLNVSDDFRYINGSGLDGRDADYSEPRKTRSGSDKHTVVTPLDLIRVSRYLHLQHPEAAEYYLPDLRDKRGGTEISGAISNAYGKTGTLHGDACVSTVDGVGRLASNTSVQAIVNARRSKDCKAYTDETRMALWSKTIIAGSAKLHDPIYIAQLDAKKNEERQLAEAKAAAVRVAEAPKPVKASFLSRLAWN